VDARRRDTRAITGLGGQNLKPLCDELRVPLKQHSINPY
jgi:hypothetical protein